MAEVRKLKVAAEPNPIQECGKRLKTGIQEYIQHFKGLVPVQYHQDRRRIDNVLMVKGAGPVRAKKHAEYISFTIPLQVDPADKGFWKAELTWEHDQETVEKVAREGGTINANIMMEKANGIWVDAMVTLHI